MFIALLGGMIVGIIISILILIIVFQSRGFFERVIKSLEGVSKPKGSMIIPNTDKSPRLFGEILSPPSPAMQEFRDNLKRLEHEDAVLDELL